MQEVYISMQDWRKGTVSMSVQSNAGRLAVCVCSARRQRKR